MSGGANGRSRQREVASEIRAVDLGPLGLDRGGHLLLRRALRTLREGARLEVRGSDPSLAVHLRSWCRANGVLVDWPCADGGASRSYPMATPCSDVETRSGPASASERAVAVLRLSRPLFDRRTGAEQAGGADPAEPGAVVEHPSARWGLAARGAWVEAATPPFEFPIASRDEVWTDEAPRLYAQAAAAQWDPMTAIDWGAPFDLPEEIEDAVVQVMTYLIENETVALIVPARFLGRIHPHFREVLQLLAIQAADEARHIEVFTRRARLRRAELGLSTAGGQDSLKTLLEEPDFALASFLLSVLGEGSFLALLQFLRENAPDPVTAQVCRLAAQDEARHVAFGMAHLKRHIGIDPGLRPRLALAVERSHDALQHTAGLNEEVFDALVLLAAGSWEPASIRRGYDAVVELQREMDAGRRRRLLGLGFAPEEAQGLSALHTRNFM